jgi:Holliday junction resolvase-like predicted endonuclease
VSTPPPARTPTDRQRLGAQAEERAARFLLAGRPHLAALAVRFDTLLLSSSSGPIEWIEGAF